MSKTHKHHVVPVHLGGKDGPIQVVTQVEHATLHAERFIDGKDAGFHMGLLQFLDPDVEVRVRQRQSDVMREKMTGFSYIEGMTWWNDGRTETLAFECPKGFSKGRLPMSQESAEKKRQSNLGRSWWNNGTKESYQRDQPRGYVEGRLPRTGNTWKETKLLDTWTGETTTFESCKQCYLFLGVTKKVFDGRRHTGKLVHNRYLIKGKNQ